MKSKKDEKNIRFSCTYHKNFVTLHPQNEPIRSVAKQKGSGFSAVGSAHVWSGFSAVGSAHVWGARGRWFESSNPDQTKG